MYKIEEVFSYNHLELALKKCELGKRKHKSTVLYHMNQYDKLIKLQNRILSREYHPRSIYSFTIYEPKKRNITANYFEDKIVQRVLCENLLEPLIQPKLIYDNYASQVGKGTHAGLHRLEKFIYAAIKEANWNDDLWVLSADISKYFYSINRDICFDLVKKLPMDNKLLDLMKNVINSYGFDTNEYYSPKERKGLCIGFQTSQWLAVYYMNGLDHFIKEKLHIKYYGRYMDDFYLIHKDKEYLKYCLEEIRKYVEEKLDLKLNKKTYIHPLSQGVCFLGYRCYFDHNKMKVITEIRKRSVHKIERKIRKHKKLIKDGRISVKVSLQSIESWTAYANHSCTHIPENVYSKLINMISDELREDMFSSDYESVWNGNMKYAYYGTNKDYNMDISNLRLMLDSLNLIFV